MVHPLEWDGATKCELLVFGLADKDFFTPRISTSLFICVQSSIEPHCRVIRVSSSVMVLLSVLLLRTLRVFLCRVYNYRFQVRDKSLLYQASLQLFYYATCAYCLKISASLFV